MFIGIYICLAGIMAALGLGLLILLTRIREIEVDLLGSLQYYTRLTLALTGIGLVVYVSLAWFAVPSLRDGRYSLPQDFQGITGVLALLIGLLGILSPLAATIFALRTKRKT